MGLTKVKLGYYLTHQNERNIDNALSADRVRGISVQKIFTATKADLNGVSLTSYKLVKPGWFAYVPDTSRRGDKICLAFNRTDDDLLVSGIYDTFCVAEERGLLAGYLFMLFNRAEFDRFARFCSWGSAREVFSWDDLCDIEIELPPIEVQRKYVAIYKAMLANQRSYEKGLDDLKLTCDALVEKLMRELRHEAIGPFIEQCDDRNSKGDFDKDAVRGLSISKQLIETKANLDGVNLCNYKVIAPGAVAYVPDTSRRGGKISIALNESNETNITSAINTVFRVKKSAEQKLLPGYLMLFFGRSEFDRYARFNSWGSARETFDWAEMCDVRIPLPDITVQRYAVELYQAWRTRLAINERLKSQLKDICPILIRGSIEEASR